TSTAASSGSRRCPPDAAREGNFLQGAAAVIGYTAVMAMDQQTAYALSTRQAPGHDRSAGTAQGGSDAARFWRERRFDDLECLKARFFRHAYAPHVHDTFALGVILSGAEAFRYRGMRHVAPAGSVVAVNPDELHDGQPSGDGYAYRML